MPKHADAVVSDFTSRNDAEPVFTVGHYYFDADNDKEYRYVQFDNGAGNVTAAAGQVVTWKTYASKVVTNDISDGATNLPAGVLQNVVTDQYYTFVQTGGRYSTLKTDGGDDIAANDTIIVDPSVDGTVDSVAAGTASTHAVVGIALAADVDANNTVDALLFIR